MIGDQNIEPHPSPPLTKGRVGRGRDRWKYYN